MRWWQIEDRREEDQKLVVRGFWLAVCSGFFNLDSTCHSCHYFSLSRPSFSPLSYLTLRRRFFGCGDVSYVGGDLAFLSSSPFFVFCLASFQHFFVSTLFHFSPLLPAALSWVGVLLMLLLATGCRCCCRCSHSHWCQMLKGDYCVRMVDDVDVGHSFPLYYTFLSSFLL